MDVVTLRIYLRHRQSVWSDVKILCSFIQHRWFDWWGYRFSVTVLIKQFRWNGFNVILTIKLFELARGFRLVVRHCAGDLDWCLRWLRGQLGHGKTIFAREEGMQLIVHKKSKYFLHTVTPRIFDYLNFRSRQIFDYLTSRFFLLCRRRYAIWSNFRGGTAAILWWCFDPAQTCLHIII